MGTEEEGHPSWCVREDGWQGVWQGKEKVSGRVQGVGRRQKSARECWKPNRTPMRGATRRTERAEMCTDAAERADDATDDLSALENETRDG